MWCRQATAGSDPPRPGRAWSRQPHLVWALLPRRPTRKVCCVSPGSRQAGPCVEPPERGAITKVQRGADQFLAPLFFPSCPVHVQPHRFTSHRTNVAESRHGLRLVFHCFYSQHSGSAFNVDCRHGTGISTALEGVVQLMVPTIKVRISRFGVFTLP